MTTTTQRLIILNTCWIAALVAASVMGYTQFVFAGDKSMVGYAIAVIVSIGVVAAFLGRKEHLPPSAWLCEVLGFAGTLVGITAGLSGGDLTTLEGLIAAGNSLYIGMGTAFCSTLIGVAGMLWLWSISKVVGVSDAET